MIIFVCFICPAYFNDVVVGGVCCRVETEDDLRKLYIMTLGCLAPYRRLGIGGWVWLVTMASL